MGMIELIVISFAAWYVAYTVVRLAGPFNVFGRIRNWATKDGVPPGSFADVITCIYCMAFWASALIYAVWVFTPLQPIVYVFAFAGGLLALNRWIDL